MTDLVELHLPIGLHDTGDGRRFQVHPSGFRNEPLPVPLLWHHHHDQPIGKVLARRPGGPTWLAEVDERALRRHTRLPLHHLGASPGLRAHYRDDVYQLDAAADLRELSLTDRPGIRSSIVLPLGRRVAAGVTLAGQPSGTVATAPATSGRVAIAGVAARYAVTVPRGPGLQITLEPGCFAKALARPAGVKILWQHDPQEPIGQVVDLIDRPRWLDMTGELYPHPDRPRARQAAADVADGLAAGLSVGFTVEAASATDDTDEHGDPIVTWHVWEAHLREISVVTFPAIPGAEAHIEHSLRARAARMRAIVLRSRAAHIAA